MRGLFEAIFGPVNGALGAIPFEWARPLTVGFLILAAVAVFLIPRDYVFLGAKEKSWKLDLRLWAVIFLIPYILIYLLL